MPDNVIQHGTYAITYTDTGTNITAHVAVTQPALRPDKTNPKHWVSFLLNKTGAWGDPARR